MSDKKSIRVRVAAIILNSKNELLLINHSKKGKNYWLFPGGGVEFGETLDRALARELKEELSITKAKIGDMVFMHDTLYPGKKRHILNVYFKVTLKSTAKIKVNPDKRIKGTAFTGMAAFKKLLFYPSMKSDIIKMWREKFRKNHGYIRVEWKN